MAKVIGCTSLSHKKSFISFNLFNSTEKGLYLGLDLGGTTVRIVLVNIHKKKIVEQVTDAFHVPEAVRQGHCTKLFDFLADSLREFLANQDLVPNGIPLGLVEFTVIFNFKALPEGSMKWIMSFFVRLFIFIPNKTIKPGWSKLDCMEQIHLMRWCSW